MQHPATSGKMTAAQRGRIFGVAGKLGLVERGNPDDDLHVLVYRETGKRSIALLSHAEAEKVLRALDLLADRAAAPTPTFPQLQAAVPSRKHDERPGGITAAQQAKVWKLMYLLRDLDETPSAATLGDRLCGIIRKTLKVDCTPEQPFRFVTLEGGWKLIEALKKYVKNATKNREVK